MEQSSAILIRLFLIVLVQCGSHHIESDAMLFSCWREELKAQLNIPVSVHIDYDQTAKH